ncbi:MAG: single-stranded DNA-binding protein [Deltaproteobacteria bacterium]|nr:single-stranded DNA-binding protein [Deltaproteobacteria bacterium]
MSLNKAMLIGHLGQDPEIRYTPMGLPVVNFSIATDEGYLDKEGKRQDRVEWYRVVVFGKVALTCNEFLKKGRQIFVEGRIRTLDFENKIDGRKQRRTEIAASRVQFLGTAPAEGGESDAIEEAVPPSDSEIPF